MSTPATALGVLSVSLLSLPTAVAASPDGPLPVSPGSPDAVARVSSACPTFSGTTAPGASDGYELVVLWTSRGTACASTAAS